MQKQWMRQNRPHPPKGRLLVVGSVRRIIGGFNFREPLHADRVDLGEPSPLSGSGLGLMSVGCVAE
ncbi:MAG: hypothetical protein QOE55_8557 [Acidobacteriaceae bacterium]|nr:hypothetical protein [Acidobacteriaceae bacterium]